MTGLKRECASIRALRPDWALVIVDFLELEDEVLIVREEDDCVPIVDAYRDAGGTLSAFLSLAVKTTQAVGKLHGDKMFHGYLSPSNILVSPESGYVKLDGFDQKTILATAYENYPDSYIAKHVLPYIAPEKTGRMNRRADYRADLYSLGVVFYEMPTGAPPFWFEDPLEIIHSHIALAPVPPMDRNHAIPQTISDIVIKLLAKSPDTGLWTTCNGRTRRA